MAQVTYSNSNCTAVTAVTVATLHALQASRLLDLASGDQECLCLSQDACAALHFLSVQEHVVGLTKN